MHVLLSGVVGSTAYGLAGPDSDVDRIGIFAAPTVAFHGLTLPITKELATVVEHEPSDSTFHEALKACHLMMGGNPTLPDRSGRLSAPSRLAHQRPRTVQTGGNHG